LERVLIGKVMQLFRNALNRAGIMPVGLRQIADSLQFWRFWQFVAALDRDARKF
jgi:hypothetical protein